MNYVFRYCAKRNDIISHSSLPRIFTQQLRAKRTLIDKKKLEIQIEKFLVRNSRLQKKSYEAGQEIFNPTKPLLPSGTKFGSRKLTHKRIIRERNISNLIRNEIQAMIEGGQVGSELQESHITLTEAYMVSSNRCRVLWKPDFSPKDVEISELLNRSSKKISHLLRTNYIINNAPELDFYIDPEIMNIAKAEELLNQCDIDLRPDSDNEGKTTKDLKESEAVEKNLYDLDYKELHSKLITLKKGNRSIT